jgi:hypothetical protein
MARARTQKLRLKLSEEQLRALKPILDQTGTLKVAGEIEDGTLHVTFLACNAAFLACNAAFSVRGEAQ